MSERIREGDLVVKVKGCCSLMVGSIFKVATIEDLIPGDYACSGCLGRASGLFAKNAELTLGGLVQDLKRIPPLDELERNQIADEVTA